MDQGKDIDEIRSLSPYEYLPSGSNLKALNCEGPPKDRSSKVILIFAKSVYQSIQTLIAHFFR